MRSEGSCISDEILNVKNGAKLGPRLMSHRLRSTTSNVCLIFVFPKPSVGVALYTMSAPNSKTDLYGLSLCLRSQVYVRGRNLAKWVLNLIPSTRKRHSPLHYRISIIDFVVFIIQSLSQMGRRFGLEAHSLALLMIR